MLTRAGAGNLEMVVLGYLLDPYDPSLNDRQIAEKIVNECGSLEDIPGKLSPVGGRYAIVVRQGEMIRIFGDCAGFRQIFFLKEDECPLWCSSQPALLSEVVPIEEDKAVWQDLADLPMFKNTTEYWFPGNRTVMKNVFHLRPNHYLDLRTGETVRYWPRDRISRYSVEECAKKACAVLQGLLECATKRFDVALGITAGLDTRVLLAASKGVAERVYFFTHTHARLDENGADIRVPREILTRFGLRHHLVVNENPMDKDFERIFRKNVTAARTRIGLNARAILNHFSGLRKTPLVVNGVCGEITRNFYSFPKWYPWKGKSLATLARMPGSRIAGEEFENWLATARASDSCGIGLLDLFYWENRNANWSAMSYSEYDIAFESLSPFNCRLLIETMLGVDKKHRRMPGFELHRQLIRRMWPELLEYEINPPANGTERVLQRLRGTRFYDVLRFLKFLHRHYSHNG